MDIGTLLVFPQDLGYDERTSGNSSASSSQGITSLSAMFLREALKGLFGCKSLIFDVRQQAFRYLSRKRLVFLILRPLVVRAVCSGRRLS